MGVLEEELGRRVRAGRSKLGLSQEELAERAGLHWTYVSGIERGRRNPSLAILVRLAVALQMPIERLLRRIGEETAKK